MTSRGRAKFADSYDVSNKKNVIMLSYCQKLIVFIQVIIKLKTINS